MIEPKLSNLAVELFDAGVPECPRMHGQDDFGAEAILLAHLKAWLRGREDVDEVSHRDWLSSGGPWIFGADLEYRLGPDKCTFVSGEGPTELEALSACVLEYLGGKQ